MNIENINLNEGLPSEGPKISFLEAFYGVLFAPKKVFQELLEEDSFTVIIYGILAIFLSNLGKLEPLDVSILNIIGTEIVGYLSWFFVGIFIFFFSTVFKTPNNSLARLLGYTGLSSIPFLLLAPIALISRALGLYGYSMFIYLQITISIWSFILFWIALAKSYSLEAWRVLLMAIVPFLLGLFLFTFLVANLLGMMFSSIFK